MIDIVCNMILVITLGIIIFSWGYVVGHEKGVKNIYSSMKDYLDKQKNAEREDD